MRDQDGTVTTIYVPYSDVDAKICTMLVAEVISHQIRRQRFNGVTTFNGPFSDEASVKMTWAVLFPLVDTQWITSVHNVSFP